MQATGFVFLQVIYTRNLDQGQLLCSSGQLPGAKAVSTVQELVHACDVSQVWLRHRLPLYQIPG